MLVEGAAETVGLPDGLSEGFEEGALDTEGLSDGLSEGFELGPRDGETEGKKDGALEMDGAALILGAALLEPLEPPLPDDLDPFDPLLVEGAAETVGLPDGALEVDGAALILGAALLEPLPMPNIPIDPILAPFPTLSCRAAPPCA